ncbi:MAG: hypothetical protein KCHDKBKB_00647 [Elusimicrobia bacterium]|nr:hypothetical protein [Elusimicrobiota bacterium]
MKLSGHHCEKCHCRAKARPRKAYNKQLCHKHMKLYLAQQKDKDATT